jgi:uncharacterized protein (TIGR00730 family)
MTEELGQWATREGHTIVFGGVNQGLMECVGKAAHEAGGRTIGVIPRIVEKSGRISDYVDIEMLCDNLSDRKQMMEDQSDVFVALPGGIGTIDELFTIAAAHTIGYHNKLVILYNMKGFWDSLIAMLDDLQQKGMVRGNWRDYIAVANNLEELSRKTRLTSLSAELKLHSQQPPSVRARQDLCRSSHKGAEYRG